LIGVLEFDADTELLCDGELLELIDCVFVRDSIEDLLELPETLAEELS
jgi:hypothetical protein